MLARARSCVACLICDCFAVQPIEVSTCRGSQEQDRKGSVGRHQKEGIEWTSTCLARRQWSHATTDMIYEINYSWLQESRMIVKLSRFGAWFETERATFRPASTNDLDGGCLWLDPDTSTTRSFRRYLGQVIGNHQ